MSAPPGRSVRTFDVTTEAHALEESYRPTRWLYYWGIGGPWVIGPILGYFALGRYGDPVSVAILVGLVLGPCVSLPVFLVYLSVRRPRPTLVSIGRGEFSFGFPGSPLRRLRLHTVAQSCRIHTFSARTDRPTPYPPEVLPDMPWVPWLDRGLLGAIALSPDAAAALKEEILWEGWEAMPVESNLGDVQLVRYTFRKPRATSGPSPAG